MGKKSASKDTVSKARREIFSSLGLATVATGTLALIGCEGEGEASSPSREIAALSGSAAILWCDTLAEQQALMSTNPSSSNLCIRRGYSTPGDGGGGLFVWTTWQQGEGPTDSTDPRGGLVVVPSGGTTAGWKRLYEGAANVRWFGAKGDNSSDDGPAIQAAIDAVQAMQAFSPQHKEMAAVFIPPGTYRVDTPVYFPSNVLIFGTGRASVIYWAGVPPQTPFTFKFMLWGRDGNSGCSNIEIHNLSFKGENGDENGAGFIHATGSQGDMLSSAISLRGGTDELPMHSIWIHDCWFENLYGFGIENGNGSVVKHVSINDCVFRYNGNGGINVDCQEAVITDNLLYNAEGLEMIGRRNTISNNIIAGGFNQGIAIYGENAVVEGNVIDMRESNTSTTDVPGQGIIASGALGCVITGNTIADPAYNGIQVWGGGIINNRNSADVTITGNTIISSRTVSAVSTGASLPELVFCVGVTRLTIQGNTLKGSTALPATVGIGIFGCTTVSVVGNTLTGTATHGIDLEGTNADVSIAHNMITSASAVGIAIQSGADSVTLVGNSVRGPTLGVRVDGGATHVRLLANSASTVSLNPQSVKYQAGNSWQDSPDT